MKQAVIPFPDLIRGDTFLGFDLAEITQTILGVTTPLALKDARINLMVEATGKIIYTWSVASGNLVIANTNKVQLLNVPGSITLTWPLGKLVYDLRVLTVDDVVMHPVKGYLNVCKNIT